MAGFLYNFDPDWDMDDDYDINDLYDHPFDMYDMYDYDYNNHDSDEEDEESNEGISNFDYDSDDDDSNASSSSAASGYGESSSELKKTPKDGVYSMQMERFEVFKEQDEERGHFDMALEVGGKKLYVHKYFLATASTTFNSMISTRWNKNNDFVIKIENPEYSYETVYQLISFIYSCQCEITADNVFVLTDMAEFYGIPLLKDRCIEFLCKMNIKFEHLENLVDIAQRYSLDEFGETLKGCVKSCMKDLLAGEQILNYQKGFIEFLSTVEKSSAQEGMFFDAAYKWANHNATIKAIEAKDDPEFDYEDSLKSEFAGILCNIKFSKMNIIFIKEFLLDKRFLFTPEELYKIVLKAQRSADQEDECFKTLYEVAKNVARDKRNESEGEEELSLRKATRLELADILPKIKFHRMSIRFLMDFVVERKFSIPFAKIYDYVVSYRKLKKEEAFKAVYSLAEKQVLKKQRSSPVKDFKLHEAVKAEISDIIAKANLNQMNGEFWMDFAIGKGFTLSPTDWQYFFDRNRWSYRNQQELFKAIYQLAEKQVLQKQKTSKIKDLSSFELIKNEIAALLPNFAFQTMELEFLIESVVGKGLLLSTTMIRDFFLKARSDYGRNYGDEEAAFRKVVRLAEKQAMEEQDGSADKTFNLVEAIKEELVETMPLVCFNKMSKAFLNNFVVAKGILTADQAKHVFYVRIEVQSDNTTITGIFDDIYGIMKAIPANGYFVTPIQWNKLRFGKLKFKIPTAPSTVYKMKGAEWYLCLEKDGVLAVKFHDKLDRSDYLLAEMKTTSDFMFDTAEAACLTACYNNV